MHKDNLPNTNVMPYDRYEMIHDEINGHIYDKGGNLDKAIDKHIRTRMACQMHNSSTDDYFKAHQHFGKGGKIGDNVNIQDANSDYNGKSGVIVGEMGNHFLVKTTKGTGLVKKTRVKIIEDDFGKGGMTKKEYTKKKVGKVMHEFKHGELHSGTSGKVVEDREQAIAIALNVAQRGWKHKRKK
jgi:ribosomal protein L21E